MDDIESFLPILYGKEQIIPLKVHNKKRDKIIYYIMAIHSDLSYKFTNDDLDYPTLEILQLAFMYMDVFLTHKSIGDIVGDDITVDPLNLGATCYVLAYKYENDDNYWNALNNIVKTFGKNRRAHVICIEKVILKLLDYKVNIVTPLSFISEFMHECNIHDRKKILEVGILATKIMITDFYWSSSKIAVMSLVLCNNCIEYLADIAKINDVLDNVTILLNAMETNWQEFTDEFEHSEIFENVKL